MPVLTPLQPIEWEDPDLVPRPVVTIGAAGVHMDSMRAAEQSESGAQETDFHCHRKGQLLLWLQGVLTCEVAGGYWIVPAHSAIWVPGGVMHRMEAAGMVECYVAYVDATAAVHLPAHCCTLSVTPLLRELVIRSASQALHYEEDGMASRLNGLLLDEIALAPQGALHLPMPASPLLRKILEMIMRDPSDRATVSAWARRVGSSERSLARLITEETGLSFGRWRRQLHLMLALKWLAQGAAVQNVARDLGYENASSFVLMFHKALGSPPVRYMAQRQQRPVSQA